MRKPTEAEGLSNLKVALIVGPCLPGRCGVGDYTRQLAGALAKAGLQVEVVEQGNWGLAHLPSLVRLVARTRADVLHLQYPTSGFAHKLGPQGLAIALPCVVTVHEASRSHLLRKLWLYPFSFRTRHVIFTSTEERAFALRWAPWIAGASSVVPIGSNIEASAGDEGRNCQEVVYFGLVMPRKGLEDVLQLAALLGNNGQRLRVRIIGSHRKEHAGYANSLRRKSEGLPVVWEEGLSDAEVGQRLAHSWIAYLPYPDGASERRGSLRAAMANGMAIITRRGPETPRDLESVVEFAHSPSEAVPLISKLLADPARLQFKGELARIYAARFSWETIANHHLTIYQAAGLRGSHQKEIL